MKGDEGYTLNYFNKVTATYYERRSTFSSMIVAVSRLRSSSRVLRGFLRFLLDHDVGCVDRDVGSSLRDMTRGGVGASTLRKYILRP